MQSDDFIKMNILQTVQQLCTNTVKLNLNYIYIFDIMVFRIVRKMFEK